MNPSDFTKCSALLLLFNSWVAQCQDLPYESKVAVEAYVGSAFYGLVDGHGEETMFNRPAQTVVDGAGNAYVWDSANRVIRRVSSGREVTTLDSGANGSPVSAIGCDAAGNVYYVLNGVLFRVPPTGLPTGGTPEQLVSIGVVSNFGFAVAEDGSVFIADPERNIVRTWNQTGGITTHVGSGNPGHLDGKGIFCSFLRPHRLAVTPRKELFVIEQGSDSLRFVSSDKQVATLTNTFEFARADVIAADELGNLYGSLGKRIAKRNPNGQKSILAGHALDSGYVNGPGPTSRYDSILGLAVMSPTVLLVGDTGNHRIRRVFLQADTGESPILEGSTLFGVTLHGLPGREYRIERADTPGDPWVGVTNITLQSTSSLWISPTHVASGVFRAVLVR